MLVAVEYITFEGSAALQGHLFNAELLLELHVGAWKRKPSGHFADNNPYATCDAAAAN
ncbi:hypothetical protein [Aestuariivirga sp.]|uniref:hypothetical protein n=1 Tax=Aestuariivirga sp. TaxID=2650926 RepID=UPI00391C35F8